MQELFTMDKQNYDPSWPVFTRDSARGIICRDGKLLLIFSPKYRYYKFPGGGIRKGEKPEEALVREVREESGYNVIPDTIREYGFVPRRQKDSQVDGIFIQGNYYYFCDVSDDAVPQKLDDYEQDEGFTPVWIEPILASAFNRHEYHGDTDPVMIKRESTVLDMVDLYLRREKHQTEELAWKNSLGEPYFAEMLDYVGNRLGDASGWVKSRTSINYSRFEHTKRVLGWALRLYKLNPAQDKINYNILVTAAIFHDVGYKEADANSSHAQIGSVIAREYLIGKGFAPEFVDRVCYLIEKHSEKWLMENDDIEPDLLLLMEADLLDDMGAQGIVMDCLIQRAQNEHATFVDAMDHIARFTLRQQHSNPMRTHEGRAIWDEKTRLVEQFYASLETDLMGWK